MDLTKEKDAVALMESSKSVTEWNDNIEKVKAANGGAYPSFWYSAVVLSGLYSRTAARVSDIRVTQG